MAIRDKWRILEYWTSLAFASKMHHVTARLFHLKSSRPARGTWFADKFRSRTRVNAFHKMSSLTVHLSGECISAFTIRNARVNIVSVSNFVSSNCGRIIYGRRRRAHRWEMSFFGTRTRSSWNGSQNNFMVVVYACFSGLRPGVDERRFADEWIRLLSAISWF